MLTLAQYIENNAVAPSAFAARLSSRLGKAVSPQNIYRWTRPTSHDDFSIPRPKEVVAIERETDGEVAVASWYQHLKKLPPRRRKAA